MFVVLLGVNLLYIAIMWVLGWYLLSALFACIGIACALMFASFGAESAPKLSEVATAWRQISLDGKSLTDPRIGMILVALACIYVAMGGMMQSFNIAYGWFLGFLSCLFVFRFLVFGREPTDPLLSLATIFHIIVCHGSLIVRLSLE
jgi:hypothetical protein